MGAMTSVTEAAWQDLLACSKADGLVQESGNCEIAWNAFDEAQQIGCLQGWEGTSMVGCLHPTPLEYLPILAGIHVDDSSVYTVTSDRCTVLCC